MTAAFSDYEDPLVAQTEDIEITEFRSVDEAVTKRSEDASEPQAYGEKACRQGERWHQCFGVRRIRDDIHDELYEGEFADDQPSGLGKRIRETRVGEAGVSFRDTYIGHFSGGKAAGYGVSVRDNLNPELAPKRARSTWAGQWEDGVVSGIGVATSTERFLSSFAGIRRTRASGEAVNVRGFAVLPDGSMPLWDISAYPSPSNGLIFYPDGRRYEGEVLAGRPFGKGAMVGPEYKKGFWVGDKFNGDNFILDHCVVSKWSASRVSCDKFLYDGDILSYLTYLYSTETVKNTFKITSKEFRQRPLYGNDQTLGTNKEPPLKVSYRVSPPDVVVALHHTNDGCKAPVRYKYTGLGKVEQVVLDLEGSAPKCEEKNRILAALRSPEGPTADSWFFAPPAGWDYDGLEP